MGACQSWPFAGVGAVVLGIVALVGNRAVFAAEADITIEQVREAWKARQGKVRTARFEWSEECFIRAHKPPRPVTPTEGSKAASKSTQSTPKWPQKDTTFTAKGAVSVSGNMLRYFHEGQYWHSDVGRLLQKHYVTTFDGKTAKSYVRNIPPEEGPTPPLGFVEREARNREYDNPMLKPTTLYARPCIVDAGGCDLSLYIVSPKRATIENTACVLLMPAVPKNSQYLYWVDPKRGFLVLRASLEDGTSKSPDFGKYGTLDISYQADPVHGWVPSGWKWILHGGLAGMVMEQTTAKVTKHEINVDIPRSEFDVDFPSGTLVRDLRTKEDYIPREDNSKRYITREEVRRGAKYEELLKTESGAAGGESNRAGRILTWVLSAVIGIVVIVVLVRVWARRTR